MRRFIVLALSVCGLLAVTASVASARVLLVGSYHGIHGQYKTLQAAVNAAKPGDWILVGPGDYKTTSSRRAQGPAGPAHRGPDHQEEPPHPRHEPQHGDHRRDPQGRGLQQQGGQPELRAQEQEAADGPQRDHGLQGQQRLDREPDRLQLPRRLRRHRQRDLVERRRRHGHDRRLGLPRRLPQRHQHVLQRQRGRRPPSTASSPATGTAAPGTTTTRATSTTPGFYVGACQQVCNQTLNHVWAEYSSLGYSGSNSGGMMVIKNSAVRQQQGRVRHQQPERGQPAAQNGSCPNGGISPITHTHLVLGVHAQLRARQQQPQRPRPGPVGRGPGGHRHVGVGGPQRHDHEQHLRAQQRVGHHLRAVPRQRGAVHRRHAATPRHRATACTTSGATRCSNNTFVNNGSYGHPSNGDFGYLNFEPGHPTQLLQGQPRAERRRRQAGRRRSCCRRCTRRATAPRRRRRTSSDPQFLTEVLCNAQVSLTSGPPSCPNGQYPRNTGVVMHRAAAQESQDHGQSVRRRAQERLVHARRRSEALRAGRADPPSPSSRAGAAAVATPPAR